MTKRTLITVLLCVLSLTASAQNYRDMDRLALFISYTSAFIDKTFETIPESDAPTYVTFEKIPCVDHCNILMNCSEIGLEGIIHPLKSSPLFLSVGSRFQISKGSRLIGQHIRYKNQAETYKLVTPVCLGYDFLWRDRKLISPSVGAVVRYSTHYTDEYYQLGFSNFLISKKMKEKDGFNNLQYGIRVGIDISGEFITMGLHYTYDLTPLMNSTATMYAEDVPTYYSVKGTTSDLQIKFGFILTSWKK